LERSVRRGMPGVICTTHIVANRWGWSGERDLHEPDLDQQGWPRGVTPWTCNTVGVQYPHFWRSRFDFGAKPFRVPLTFACHPPLSGRLGRNNDPGERYPLPQNRRFFASLYSLANSGYPRLTHVHRVWFGWVGRSFHKWPGGRSKTGHPADAPTLGTPHSSVRGRGQIPFPLVSHPAYLSTGRAFPHRIWRGLYSVPVLCCRHPPGIRRELRFLAVFAKVPTQELGPRRRRG
jgi:hypothetical protein